MNTANDSQRLRFRALSYHLDQITVVPKQNRILVKSDRGLPHWFGIGNGKERRRILEDFANCSGESDDIRRFTLQHGPLESGLRPSEPSRNALFTFEEWRSLQREYRQLWDALARPRHRMFGWAELKTVRGEKFTWFLSRLTYEARSLYRLLRLELCATPRSLIRKCVHKDCQKPYFVADHGRQLYCKTCKVLAHRECKARSWHRNKDLWRPSQKN